MPHVDDLAPRAHWLNNGISPFARPVAAISIWVQSIPARVSTAFATWNAGSLTSSLDHWYDRPEWEMRKQEDRYTRATDLADLEGMEREFNRRDGSSIGLRD